MNVAELSVPPKGELRLDVYRGDVTREPLTREQIEENELWANEGKLWFTPTLDYLAQRAISELPQRTWYGRFQILDQVALPWQECCKLPVYAGRIIDLPIDTLFHTNVVTTNGKGLLLDRLFAMGGPPSQLLDMGVGNSSTAAAATDTQLLGSSPSPDLRAFDSLPTRSGLVVTSIRTYATGEGNMNWQEIGQFNGGTNGTSILFNRIAPIGAFNKTSSVSIAATMTTTQS